MAARLALRDTRDTVSDGGAGSGRLLAVPGCAVLSGAVTGYAAARLMGGGYGGQHATTAPAGATTFLAVAVAACALSDRLRSRSRVPPLSSAPSHQQPGDPVGDGQRPESADGRGSDVARPRRPEDPLLTQDRAGPDREGQDHQR